MIRSSTQAAKSLASEMAASVPPRTPMGTIVTNPGGPGQPTIAFAGLYLDALAPLRTRRDLLLIDPRGTGQSGALMCPSLSGPVRDAEAPACVGRRRSVQPQARRFSPC